ncbi:MAG: hypothetical protein KDD92_08055 [Caldilineaceae bacterium]|nr:hypothetical protein [Caldilineaceae bacterium]
MRKASYLLGIALFVFGLLVGALVTGAGTSVLAQDATPAPTEESVTEAEAITMTMTVTEVAAMKAQQVLDAAEAADESLFVNLTSDDLNRAAMAITFSQKVLEMREIPVTIFLNVDGVRLVDTTIPQAVHPTGETIQEKLTAFMDAGGTVLICPFCMQNVGGMSTDEVLEGVMSGMPDLTQGLMFAEGARTMSY